MKRLRIYIIAAALCCVFAFSLLGIVILRLHDTNTRINTQLEALRGSIGNNALVYGLLVSYNSSTRVLVMRTRNRFDASGADQIVRHVVARDAFVGEQELTFEDGVARLSTITPKTPQDLSSLPEGTRLRLLSTFNKGTLSAIYVLFGNPL
jgi:hypothetical protein